MLPFIYVDTVWIGFFPVRPFGVLVAAGFLLWDSVATRRAKELGYDLKMFRSLQLWALAFAGLMAHVVDEVFYFPEQVLARPLSLLFFWESMSSIGGILGALLGGLIWRHFEWRNRGPIFWLARRARPLPVLPFAEVIVATLPILWMFGRAACAVIHDHPGIAVGAGNPFSVAFPAFDGDGRASSFGPIHFLHGSDPRLDLGLLEMLFLAVVTIGMTIAWRKRLPLGSYAALMCIGYAPVRFVLDFFRLREGQASDRRLAGLTFAQWMCIGFLALGFWVLRYARRRAASLSPGDDPAAPVRAVC